MEKKTDRPLISFRRKFTRKKKEPVKLPRIYQVRKYEKKPTAEEERNKLEVRKSVVTRKKIKKGEAIQRDSLTIKRPGTGIEPRRLAEVIGKKALRDLEADRVISWDEIG